MTSLELAAYLRRIRQSYAPPVLHHLAQEIERAHPDDEATPRLTTMALLKKVRIEHGN